MQFATHTSFHYHLREPGDEASYYVHACTHMFLYVWLCVRVHAHLCTQTRQLLWHSALKVKISGCIMSKIVLSKDNLSVFVYCYLFSLMVTQEGHYSGLHLIQAGDPCGADGYKGLPVTDILLSNANLSLTLSFSALCFRYTYHVT